MSRDQAENDFLSELRYHEREWRIERVGWLLLLAFIVAALLGVFGDGPLSERTIGDEHAGSIRYERFGRYATPMLLEMTLVNPPQQAIVEINATYLQDFEVTSIVPEPRDMRLVGDRYRFTFVFEQGQGTIVLHVTPLEFGAQHAVVAIEGAELSFSQFIYP